jgi:nicotinamidase-related amidase
MAHSGKEITVRSIMLVTCLAVTFFAGVEAPAGPVAERDRSYLRLELRSRIQPFKGSADWEEITLSREFATHETAILICDMWDKHWCVNASKRCDVLARKMAPLIESARSAGVLIVHAPSECMDFYKDTPQRRRILEAPRVQTPQAFELTDPPLPVDASEGGCDDERPVKSFKAWTRQHEAIPIADPDVISDRGEDIHGYLQQRGIKNLIIMGVHTNMCVLGRSFGIRQMTRWGMRCVLVRDLTDSMYDPRKPPHVSHEEGTELIVRHIEKYWCPSMLGKDLSKTYTANK